MSVDIVNLIGKYLAAGACFGVLVWLTYVGKVDPGVIQSIATAGLAGLIGYHAK